MIRKSYLKAVVIVHGKSEYRICDYIKRDIRLKIEIYSEKKGKKSIQITSLKNVLGNTIFKSLRSLKNNYGDLEVDPKSKLPMDYFKIFIIMDTDDCNEETKIRYMTKKLFINHWAYDYIVPIWNINNLEDVLEKSGVKFTKKGNNRKSEYIDLFPTDKNYTKSDVIQIEELCEQLKNNKNTNLNEFLEFCLKYKQQ